MSDIVSPNIQAPIVDKNGRPTQVFWSWMEAISREIVIRGTGSPENVVAASQGRIYADMTVSATPVLYLKRQASISGDAKRGWEAV